MDALLVREGTSSTEPRMDGPVSPVRQEPRVTRSVIEEFAVCMRGVSNDVRLKSGDDMQDDSGVAKVSPGLRIAKSMGADAGRL